MVRGLWLRPSSSRAPCYSCRCVTTTYRLDIGTSGKSGAPRAGMRRGVASGRKSGSGEAVNMNERTIKASKEGAATGETDSGQLVSPVGRRGVGLVRHLQA